MELILIFVAFIAIMYFFMIRPQKKRMEQQQQMISALEPGSRVLLSTGFYGTLRATGNEQVVVELAPGVEVTVLKQAIMKAVSADDEEFAYADESTADDSVDAAVSDTATPEVSTSDESLDDSAGSHDLGTDAALTFELPNPADRLSDLDTNTPDTEQPDLDTPDSGSKNL